MYGVDAFTSIINIITFKGNEDKGLHFSSSGGSFNTTDNTIVANIGDEDISISVGGKYYNSDEPFMLDYYPQEYQWYNHYKQTGEMLIFADTLKPAIIIKNWPTPTKSYSAYVRLNYKKLDIGYSNNYESHSSSAGYPPQFAIYTNEAIYANRIQNAYISHTLLSSNKKLGLNTTLSGQDFKTLPNSLFYNQYASYNPAFKYEHNRTVKIEEQINYQFNEKFDFVGGVSYEYADAIPKTSDLPIQYNENVPYNLQYIWYPGTNVKDTLGNDLTIYQDI